MTHGEKMTAELIAAVILAFLIAAWAPAAGLNDFTARYIADVHGAWWRVDVPANAEYVRLCEDGRAYRLHCKDRSVIQFPTPGWTLYDGRTGKTTVLNGQPGEGSP